MRKRIAGSVMIAAAALLAFHPTQILTSENQKTSNQQEKIQDSYDHADDRAQGNFEDNPTGQIPVTLIETIDGDTIKVKVNGKTESVRYLLVDTPESKKPGMCVQPYAMEAFLRNQQLMMGGKVSIEFEHGNTRDSYGRLLAYVYVDGNSVQEALIKEGFARVAYIMNPPYKYLRVYRDDEDQAKKQGLNIWSLPNYVTYRGFVGCTLESNRNGVGE